MQGLRSKNVQLERVNAQIDNLIENIRTELLARNDESLELSNGKITQLLKYIANPLKNFSIDGDQDILLDKSDLYEKVIGELDRIMNEKRYADGKELSESEVESFKKARDVMQADKENGIDIIEDVYREILTEHRAGKLERAYVKEKIEDNEELQNLRKQILPIEEELILKYEPALQQNVEILKKLDPEMDLCEKRNNAYGRLNMLSEELDKVDNELAEPDLVDERKKELQKQRSRLLSLQIAEIKSNDPERYSDPKFERKEIEVNGEKILEKKSEYLNRLVDDFNLSSTAIFEDFRNKLSTVLNEGVYFLAVDQTTGDLQIEEQTVGEKYFLGETNSSNLDSQDVLNFIDNIHQDTDELRSVIRGKREERAELEEQKEQFEEVLMEDIKCTTAIATTPYKNDENISPFGKWAQRMAFRFKNPSYFFKGRKKVEQGMINKKGNVQTSLDLKVDRTQVLKDIENKQRNFKDKIHVKTQVKQNVFKSWDESKNKSKGQDR